MIRIIKTVVIPAESGMIEYIEGFCESDDTMPAGNIATGSIMTEVNTGDVYFYSEESEEWVKQFSFQPGS